MKKNKTRLRVSFNSSGISEILLKELTLGILGAKKVLDDPGFTVYELPDGTLIEIYGRGMLFPQRIFEGGDVVLSFQVEDIELSVERMVASGAQHLDGIIQISETYSYCHLSLGEGQIVGLHQIG